MMKTVRRFVKFVAVAAAVCGFALTALADWTYDTSAKTISDGNWTLTTTIAKNTKNLTVTGFVSANDLSDLDLCGAVTGTDSAAYVIVGVQGLNVADVQAGLVTFTCADTQTSVGGSAFNACTNLTTVALSDVLTTLGNNAFANCTKLSSVTPLLPASITALGQKVFQNCPLQGELVIGREKSISFTTSGGDANQSAFYNTCISKVFIGEKIPNLYAYLFQNCTNLESVVFEGPLAKIYDKAFSGCTKLSSVTPLLPPTVSSLGVRAFYNCPIEGVLSIGEGVASVGFGGSGGHAEGDTFMGSRITDFIAGTGVTFVVGTFMKSVTTLTNVVFKGNITSIGYNSFNGCTALRHVTPLLPPSVNKLEYGSFRSCPIEGVLTLGVNSKVTYGGEGGNLDNYSFGGSHITDFIVGTNLTAVPPSFFNTCSTLTNVDLSAATNLTSVGYRAFYSNSALKNVVFAELKPTFGNEAFNGNPADYCARFVYPKKSASWSDYIATLSFTPWADASETATNTYWANFPDGPEPRGFATVNGKKKWFVPKSDAIAGQVNLTLSAEKVDGMLLEIGEPTPDYGDFGVVTTPFPASVSQYGEDGDIVYESCGYRVYKMGDEFWEEQETVPDARTVDFDPGSDGDYRLAWLWRDAAYAVKVDSVDPSVGSLSVDGTLLDAPTLEGTYYVSNTVVTLTARSGGLEFKRWFGDVPAGEETANEIRVTVDGIKKLSAYFETPWTYDDTTKTISDGYWTLGVSGSTSGLTISSVQKMPAGLSLLDLSKPTDGHVVTAIGASAFKGSQQVVEVVLPPTLTSLGSNAFDGCTNLRSVTPLLPASITDLGQYVFRNCPIQGELVMGREKSISFAISGGDANQSAFYNTCLSRVIVGEKITNIYAYLFQNCTNLESVVFEGPLAKIYDKAFSGCTKLSSVTPLLPPTVSSLGVRAFYNCPIEGVLSLGEATVGLGGEGGHSDGSTFFGSRITEYVAGTGVTYVIGSMFNGVTTLTNVVFKGALTSVGYTSFNGCTNLKSVTPLLPPSVVTLDYGAFCNCPLEGALYLGMTNSVTYGVEGGDKHNNAFQKSKLSEIHLGPALTSLPKDIFASSGVTNDVYIYGMPTFGTSAFSGLSSNSRFFLNLDEPSWNVWLADEANATAWTNLTPEAQAVYYDAWGAGAKRPKARAVKSLAPFPQNAWLLRFRPRTDGMRIIFR